MSTVPCWWFPVPYDPAPYTDDREEFVWCMVTVTLPDGETRTTTGDYLNLDDMPALHCGIEEMALNLGLLHYLSDEELYLKVCREVTRQLALRPRAVLTCPELTARLELVVPK